MAAVNEQTETAEAPRADIDLDLTDVRSRISDLHIESIGLATDLLSVLGPLQRHVVRAVDLDVDIIELTRESGSDTSSCTFGHDERAVLELESTDDTNRFALDLSHIAR